MRDPQNEKRDHPHLPPSEVEGVRIVVISFRNIAKKKEKFTPPEDDRNQRPKENF